MGKRVQLRSMDRIFDLIRTTLIERGDSYLVTYPHIIDFFAQRTKLTASDVVVGSHIVYGWMPTILELHPDSIQRGFDGAARLLNQAKAGGDLTENELCQLKALVNRSIVGASKLLHFIAPQRFAIWDSRIYRFLTARKPSQTTVNNVPRYSEYLQMIRELTTDDRFGGFHETVKKMLGYDVSKLRAAELVMFLKAPGDPLKAKDN